MKKNIACAAALLLALLPAAKATTTLTAWTFDNLAIATNGSPQPSTGFGAASPLGISGSYILGIAGSSSGNTNCWNSGANGWSTNAPIGTQGARFSASTLGYYQIQVSFDVYATTDAVANLQVQYTTEGTIWHNATITSVGTLGAIANNAATNNSTVIGSYVILTNNGTTGWNNQIAVNLSGISGVDNNANFAIRMVNASTGTNCLNAIGTAFNNTSGSWSFDNVIVQGVSFDTVADWTFESEPNNGTIITNPMPEISVGNYTFAQALGFNNTYTFAGASTPGSTNGPDVVNTGASSSGAAGPNAWRVRGNPGNNGWNTAAPIGTQGAEFDVSTLNFSNILVTFDLYSTSQGEAKMCVLYTTDGWATTNVGQNLFYPANPTFIVTNPASGPLNSPDTVVGTYFYQNTGQNFYNYMTVDFTGIPAVANNPLFGIKIVNAATGPDCVAYNGGSYNNSSGNWRYDNVAVSGQYNGLTPPTLTSDPNATVDHPFTNTFTDNPTWRSAITAIYVNGSVLTNSAYTTNTPGMIKFTPSKSVTLQLNGIDNIVILAAGYGSVKVTQPIAAGVATKLTITQPAAPSASSGTLAANPVVAITDQYGNGTTNPYANFSVSAAVGGAGGWTLGGAIKQASVNGYATFTNLSATVNGSAAVNGAVIAFTMNGYTNSSNGTTTTNFNSSSFNIGAPPVPFTRGNLAVLQIDTVANNTTFSMIEVKPSAANQTTPVNIVPISATGTNALRQSSAGSTGKLAISDDGTLLCFAAFADGSSATPDETFVLNRAVGALNYTNLLTSPASYVSTSLGGSQARAAVTVDGVNWIIDDKGGLYYGRGYIPYANINALNNVVVKSFAGTAYVQTQKTANGSPIPTVYALAPGNPPVPVPNNLGTDPLATDFYIVSTNGGDNSIMYTIDQVSSSLGIINKYSWVPDSSQISGYAWEANGTFTNATGGDGLFATTNGNGGVYIFFTTGGGGTAGNSIVRVTDAAGWNQPINITSSNVIYTASKTTSLKGLTFVPQQIAYANELIPPPILTAQTFAATNSPFSVTNTPDDPLWRSSITGITVNGSPLPAAAYATNLPGVLVFDPSQSALLQSPSLKTIVISATSYSTNSVAQTVAGVAAKLAITTQPKAPVANGGALATQPVVAVQDASGNAVASSASILASVGAGTWTLGGNTNKAAVNGTVTFSGLTAFSPSAVNGATITFSSSGLTGVTSSSFNIPAPILSSLVGVKLSGGSFIFSFTNATGLSFSVLATNNAVAPKTNWPVVGHPIESPAGSGKYQFTNSPATNPPQFFILSQP